MRTYRELFALPEFTPMFISSSAFVAGGTISGIGLGALVYSITGSPLLTALSMFGSSFGQVVGAMALLSVADRVAPRAAMTAIALVFAAVTLAIAVPGVPVAVQLGLIVPVGCLGAVNGGVKWGLLSEVVPADGYVLGRSVFNMSTGLMQIAGFGLGGALIALTSPRTALLLGASTYLLAAALSRYGLRERPPRAQGRPSVGETWRVNRLLLASRHRRILYLALWVPNGLIVGCEALFIPYSPGGAGLLLMAAAAGMLAGDIFLGRFVMPGARSRLVAPLRFGLAIPYLFFAFHLPAPIAAALAAVASVGYGATLLLQDQLIAATPEELTGQALGLHSSGMLTMQAVCATLAGALGQIVSPATAIALMAVASVAVCVALTPGLRAKAETMAL